MTTTKRPRWHAMLALLGGILFVIVLLLAAAMQGTRVRRDALATWDASAPEHVAPPPVLPAEITGSAQRLIDAARDLGVNLGESGAYRRDLPGAGLPLKGMREVSRELMRAPRSGAVVVPADTVAWLDAHAAAIDACVGAALETPSPQWPARAWGGRPAVPEAGLRVLHGVLLARALDDAADGRHERAAAALAADFALGTAVLAHRESFATADAMQRLRETVAAARQIDVDAQAWLHRVSALRPRDDADGALAAFVRAQARAGAPRDPEGAPKSFTDAMSRVVRRMDPHLLITARMVRATIERVSATRRALRDAPPCGGLPPRVPRGVTLDAFEWATEVGRSHAQSALDLEREVALTRRALAIRAGLDLEPDGCEGALTIDAAQPP